MAGKITTLIGEVATKAGTLMTGYTVSDDPLQGYTYTDLATPRLAVFVTSARLESDSDSGYTLLPRIEIIMALQADTEAEINTAVDKMETLMLGFRKWQSTSKCYVVGIESDVNWDRLRDERIFSAVVGLEFAKDAGT